MLSAYIRFGSGQLSTDTDLQTLIKASRDPKATFWLDMSRPTDDEYAILDDVFGFHPLAIEDAMVYSQRPKIESYNHIGDAHHVGYFFMAIHGPDIDQFKDHIRLRELDLFVSERYLITIHEEELRSVDYVRERAHADARVVLDNGIDVLLHSILDQLVDKYFPILDHLQEALDDIEDRATTEPSHEVLSDISARKRDLMNLRRTIGPQREVLALLTRGEVPFIRETTRIYFRDVLDHLTRALETVDVFRDIVTGCRDIYMSSINNQLNQVMKTLTIISVTVLPITAITGFLGMNFPESMSQVLSRPVFVTAIGVMLLMPALILWVFHRRKWL